MITRSRQFDLGLDKTRIKDPRDARRQEATVDALMDRFLHKSPEHRWEIEILADEVGMGKTFVGLGVAFSVLEATQQATAVDDRRGCYQEDPDRYAQQPGSVLEVAARSWRIREMLRQTRIPHQASRWFAPAPMDRIDDLAYELRRSGSAPRVIIANMRIFGGGQLRHYDLKRRYLLKIIGSSRNFVADA
ncbi:MAG: hypothetical protein KDA79_13195 [Planctomycetaceae bacterium]|nr:hypothetical protein [Planctomycetaceae bacterium]